MQTGATLSYFEVNRPNAPEKQSAVEGSPETWKRSPGALAGSTVIVVEPTIPDHQLIRCIGQGSYGEVWLARNIDGPIDHR